MEHKISEKKRYQLSRIILENTKKKRISSGNYYSVLIVRVGNCSFCNETPAKKHKTSSIHADTVVGSAVPPDDDAVQPENPMGQPVVWHCGPNDLILIKPKETIQIQSRNSQHAAELLWIQYSEELLAELSEEGTDLLKSMEVVPFSCISVPTDGGTAAILKNLFTRLERSEQEKDDFGARLFEKNMLSLMIVIILRACIRSEFEKTRKGHRQFVLDDLFAYIHRHISEELTLERLEKVFFVSRYHICREYKKQTGQTLHSYITKNRLRMCKKYIIEGMPITEVYKMAGFGGYNHFFRAFKKEYGMTPKEYYKSHMTL